MYIEPRLPDHTDIWTANLNSRIVHCFGDIEENMSFAAVIADRREAVEDVINRELFKG